MHQSFSSYALARLGSFPVVVELPRRLKGRPGAELYCALMRGSMATKV
ncbi:hypothetical protein [Alsobacter sp. SYSU BS001988]